MDGNWLTDDWEEQCFTDEPIAPHYQARMAKLPPLLAKARDMENGKYWQTRQEIFLKQGRLLADYKDDFHYEGDPLRYYPTYQSLTDNELRGYFTWRTKARGGEYAPGPLSFIFLYIYELLNQIGVKDPMEGYEALLAINREYGAMANRIPAYLDTWLMDYVIYYNLDKSLIEDAAIVSQARCVAVLENVRNEPDDRIIDAVKQLSTGWLSRSRFYSANFEELDPLICRILRRTAGHYAKKCKYNMAEQFFGYQFPCHLHLFNAAIFCDPLKRKDYEYAVNDQYIIKCESGYWTTRHRVITRRSSRKLDKFLKTIDAITRDEYGFKSPIKAEVRHKWLETIIREETRAYLAEKAAPPRLVLDLSQLDKIRADAAVTRDRLIVEDELEPEQESLPQTPVLEPKEEGAVMDPGLAPHEKRFLRCLLAGEDTGWIRSEGYLETVLVDAINEKLYDIFGDSVIDEAAGIVEDYLEDLKAMVEP